MAAKGSTTRWSAIALLLIWCLQMVSAVALDKAQFRESASMEESTKDEKGVFGNGCSCAMEIQAFLCPCAQPVATQPPPTPQPTFFPPYVPPYVHVDVAPTQYGQCPCAPYPTQCFPCGPDGNPVVLTANCPCAPPPPANCPPCSGGPAFPFGYNPWANGNNGENNFGHSMHDGGRRDDGYRGRHERDRDHYRRNDPGRYDDDDSADHHSGHDHEAGRGGGAGTGDDRGAHNNEHNNDNSHSDNNHGSENGGGGNNGGQSMQNNNNDNTHSTSSSDSASTSPTLVPGRPYPSQGAVVATSSESSSTTTSGAAVGLGPGGKAAANVGANGGVNGPGTGVGVVDGQATSTSTTNGQTGTPGAAGTGLVNGTGGSMTDANAVAITVLQKELQDLFDKKKNAKKIQEEANCEAELTAAQDQKKAAEEAVMLHAKQSANAMNEARGEDEIIRMAALTVKVHLAAQKLAVERAKEESLATQLAHEMQKAAARAEVAREEVQKLREKGAELVKKIQCQSPSCSGAPDATPL